MRSLLIICLTGLLVLHAKAQEKYSLSDCHQKAVTNHPLGLKKADFEKINQLNLKVISSSYLPQLKLSGQATYQSDVVEISFPDIPGLPNLSSSIPSPSKDQYKVAVDVNQVIYDGGLTKCRKDLENASYKTNVQQVEVDLYSLKERVNQAFFQAFTLDESLRLLQDSKKVLDEKYKTVQSGVKNGVLLSSDQMVVEAELLKLEQTIEEVEISKESTKRILEVLVGESLDGVEFTLPENTEILTDSVNRPEELLFDYQHEKLMSAEKLKGSENMPKLVGFGQFGYGKPGLNLLNDEFDTYYMVGLSLSWNLWDWQKVRNERQVYKIQGDVINKSKEAFDKSIEADKTLAEGQIQKLNKAIEKDKQLIDLKNKILESVSAQLEHGVITSTDYIVHLNDVTQANINLKTHEIQLIQAKINYKTILGNL